MDQQIDIADVTEDWLRAWLDAGILTAEEYRIEIERRAAACDQAPSSSG